MTAIVLPTLVYSLSTKLTAYCTCLWQNKNRSLGISHTLPNSSQHNNSVASTRPPLIHLTAAAVLRAPVGNAGTAAAPKIKRSELPLRAQVDLDPSRSTQLERSGPSCVAVCLRVVYAPHEEQPQVVGIATRCSRFRIFWSPTHPHRLTLDKFRPKRWN